MTERPARGRRADYADFYSLQTRWSDNDIYGHMNNAVYYSLIDTAVNSWLIERGLLDIRSSQTYGLAAESGCRYHAEMAYPCRVTAGLRISRLGNSSVRYEVGLFADDDDLAAAEGFFVHVYVDRTTHRPVPIDEARKTVMRNLVRG